MLSRPTTEQILIDCRNELLATIEPAMAGGPAKVALQMLENVLRNCAGRAGHEIAWMHEEGAAMVDFAESVAASELATDAVTDALTAHAAGRSDSLHLDDVCATYDLAGECLSTAIEAVMAKPGDPRAEELQLEGRSLLEVRLAHENEIMGEWAFVGRS